MIKKKSYNLRILLFKSPIKVSENKEDRNFSPKRNLFLPSHAWFLIESL